MFVLSSARCSSPWYRGVFRWEDEFGPASEYASAYRACRGDNYPGGPALEISVNDGKVTTRGWVRRAKEDFGIIVEDGRKADDGTPQLD